MCPGPVSTITQWEQFLLIGTQTHIDAWYSLMLCVIEIQQEICKLPIAILTQISDELFKYKVRIARPVGELAGLAFAFC